MAHLINAAKLNVSETGIIIRLITEHIELNEYLFRLKLKCPKTKEIPPTNKCNTCYSIESVRHYILKCKKYKTQRQKLKKKLIKINHKFKYQKFQTMKYLLFPYKIHNNSKKQQAQIWREILSYIKGTKRFENLYDINLKEI